MKVVNFIGVWEAYTNSDLTEGKGSDVHIGYFNRESDAKQAVKGRGVWGTDASVRPAEIHIKIYESYKEFEDETMASARRRALDKLSFEEKKALNLL